MTKEEIRKCDEFGYAVLLCKHAEWKQYHEDKQTQAADEAAQLTGAPTYQVVELVDTWSDKERTINKLLHEQEADAFLLASNVDKALILCIREIFNESIWADMNRGTTIGTSSLRTLSIFPTQIKGHRKPYHGMLSTVFYKITGTSAQ